ncbi:MAG: GNAT family N-acetyltransferase [Anaerolineae bacterium]
MMNVVIMPMKAADWEAVQAIYREGIATGNATFETDIPPWEAWDRSHRGDCRLIAAVGGQTAGWAALQAVSRRAVYAGVAEVSVYVAERWQGMGVGTALLQALVEASERAGVWTLQAGIFPENRASVALHKKMGFRIVGTRERIGCLHGVWRDVLLMERRSQVVGR